MKKYITIVSILLSTILISNVFATDDNGFYNQPLPNGITPTGETYEEWFEFEDELGKGWANYKQTEVLPQKTIASDSTSELIKAMIKEETSYRSFYNTKAESLSTQIAVYKYCYNVFYEMLRRDDLTESLFCVYADDTITPQRTNNGNFDIGSYLETFMIIDQIENGPYTQAEQATLQDIFWEKNIVRDNPTQVDEITQHYVPGEVYNNQISEIGGSSLLLIHETTDKEYQTYVEERVRIPLSANESIEGISQPLLTNNGHPLEAYYDCWYILAGITHKEFSVAFALQFNQKVKNDHPNEDMDFVGWATPKYNCHSWAWYKQDVNNRFWISSAYPYTKDSNVTEISMGAVKTGDIVVYGNFDHSAVFIERDLYDMKESVVRSKWGVMALIDHRMNNTEYFTTFSALRFYRKS